MATPALRALLLACWWGLLLSLSAPLVFSETASIGLWLMQVVPLLLTWPGVAKLDSRALQWLAFLVLFYFLNGVLQASSAAMAQRVIGTVTLLLCLTLFTAVIVVVRRNRRLSKKE